MLSGFNTNLRHRGVLFHVQTEDSGRANPHIISHLFHGGNILVSRKSSYGDMLEKEDLTDAVREMMEGQHKAMLRGLISGQSDEKIIARLGADIFVEDVPDTVESFPAPETEPLIEELEPIAPEVAAEPVVEDSKERIARAFGDGVVSQKPLDEVVLDYLVQSARKRKRPSS